MTTAEELGAEGEAEDYAEGYAEGRQLGRVKVLVKLLMLKFGALSTKHALLIVAATEQQLDVYVERILTATSADQVFGSP